MLYNIGNVEIFLVSYQLFKREDIKMRFILIVNLMLCINFGAESKTIPTTLKLVQPKLGNFVGLFIWSLFNIQKKSGNLLMGHG